MKDENTAAVVVRNEEGKILLVKRGSRTFHGWWCLPGGHSEKGETPEQAAQREANEEIGEVELEKKPFLIFVHDWPADSHTNKPHKHKCHCFNARVTGDIRPGDDAADIGWFTLEEAKKLQITDSTRTVLDRLSK